MLYADIKERRIQAMKNKDTRQVNILKLIEGELQRNPNGKPEDMTEDQVVKVLRKIYAGLQETMDRHVDAGTTDTDEYANVLYEATTVSFMLPVVMDEEQTVKAVQDAITATGAQTMKDMGKVMGHLKKTYGSELDGKIASAKVKEALV